MILISVFIGAMGTLSIDQYVSSISKDRIYTDVNSVPDRDVALVLGTSRYAYGRRNLFYIHRLNAAAKLFHKGKVKGIIVSGDNSTRYYDEPTNMKTDLIKKGIPGKYITCDYAGFRTLDSVVRAEKVFGFKDYIVISQMFHCERAIYTGLQKGHEPIAFTAKDVGSLFGLKVRIREIFARTKAFLDINILKTEPRFLGKKEKVVLKKSLKENFLIQVRSSAFRRQVRSSAFRRRGTA